MRRSCNYFCYENQHYMPLQTRMLVTLLVVWFKSSTAVPMSYDNSSKCPPAWGYRYRCSWLIFELNCTGQAWTKETGEICHDGTVDMRMILLLELSLSRTEKQVHVVVSGISDTFSDVCSPTRLRFLYFTKCYLKNIYWTQRALALFMVSTLINFQH